MLETEWFEFPLDFKLVPFVVMFSTKLGLDSSSLPFELGTAEELSCSEEETIVFDWYLESGWFNVKDIVFVFFKLLCLN